MRLLLTGCRGLLGAAVQREFHSDEIIALDHGALDITDDRAVSSAVATAQPDLIINCAAYNNVDRAEDEPVEALTVNGFAVQSLASAASDAGSTLVHFSSDFVFDGEGSRPYVEEDPPNPRSVYAASKLLGDWFALRYSRAYVLRVESLFGPPGPEGSRQGSLGLIVDRINAGEEVPLFVDRQVSPTHTADIARAIRRIIERDAPPGLYHCVNGDQATWREIAEHVANLLGKPLGARPLTLATANLRARRPRYSALSNAKLTAAAYEMPTWQRALEEFLKP